MVASDGPGEYPVITESRAGNDGAGVTVTPGTVAYVTTGGVLFSPLLFESCPSFQFVFSMWLIGYIA